MFKILFVKQQLFSPATAESVPWVELDFTTVQYLIKNALQVKYRSLSLSNICIILDVGRKE